jgi:hypothetical protein
VLSRLAQGGVQVLRQYETLPYVALDLPAGALPLLNAASGDVVRVIEDVLAEPSLAASVPLIQGDQAWQSGYDGTGAAIAVLDSGVEATHPFFGGRVVAEACFSSTVKRKTVTLCPNGKATQTGPGAAAPCDSIAGCDHGTHVTGIAAGNGDPIGQPFSGVAKNASIMAVQVFSKVTNANQCGGTAPCLGAFTSDVIAGLEHVYSSVVSGQLDVVAVNMSLGAGAFTAPCDAEAYKPAIDNLRSVGVASVVASGRVVHPGRRLRADERHVDGRAARGGRLGDHPAGRTLGECRRRALRAPCNGPSGHRHPLLGAGDDDGQSREDSAGPCRARSDHQSRARDHRRHARYDARRLRLHVHRHRVGLQRAVARPLEWR